MSLSGERGHLAFSCFVQQSPPTSSSWLNAVEGFLAQLTRRRPKHGVFTSVANFENAITRFIEEHHSAEAKPFKWPQTQTKSSPREIEGSKRCSQSTKCLIPCFDGAISFSELREALWAKFFMGAPLQQRQSVRRYNLERVAVNRFHIPRQGLSLSARIPRAIR